MNLRRKAFSPFAIQKSYHRQAAAGEKGMPYDRCTFGKTGEYSIGDERKPGQSMINILAARSQIKTGSRKGAGTSVQTCGAGDTV